MKTKRKTVIFSALLAVLILATVFLSACNKPATSGDIEYGVYIRRTLYSKDEGVMTVYAALTSDERMTVEGATANWHFVKSNDNAFYYRYDYTVSFSPKAIFSAIKDSLTQEQLIIDDVEYKVLKLVFEYATIYKSLESEGNILVSDGQYLHDFPLDENADEFATTLSIRTQNSATWYGLLVAAAVVVFGVVIGILLARRKKYATKERTENN